MDIALGNGMIGHMPGAGKVHEVNPMALVQPSDVICRLQFWSFANWTAEIAQDMG